MRRSNKLTLLTRSPAFAELIRTLRDFRATAGRASAVAGASDDLVDGMRKLTLETAEAATVAGTSAADAERLVRAASTALSEVKELRGKVSTLKTTREKHSARVAALETKKAELLRAGREGAATLAAASARLAALDASKTSLDGKIAADISVTAHATQEIAEHEAAKNALMQKLDEEVCAVT